MGKNRLICYPNWSDGQTAAIVAPAIMQIGNSNTSTRGVLPTHPAPTFVLMSLIVNASVSAVHVACYGQSSLPTAIVMSLLTRSRHLEESLLNAYLHAEIGYRVKQEIIDFIYNRP